MEVRSRSCRQWFREFPRPFPFGPCPPYRMLSGLPNRSPIFLCLHFSKLLSSVLALFEWKAVRLYPFGDCAREWHDVDGSRNSLLVRLLGDGR